MFRRYLVAALMLGFISLGVFANTNQKTHYETRICRGCDYNYALKTAEAIKPDNNCHTDGIDVCTLDVLVIDADSRNLWRFENTYINSGQSVYKMSNDVNYHPSIPKNTIKLANQLLDIYETIHQLTLDARPRLKAENIAATRKAKVSSDSCAVYQYAQALDATFSPRYKSSLQYDMQSRMDAGRNWAEGLIETEIGIPSFVVSNAGDTLDGNWLSGLKSMHITRIFGSGDIDGLTQVTYNTTMINDSIVLSGSDMRTYYSGMGLDIMKAQRISVDAFDACFISALDAKYPKVVASPSVGSLNIIPLVVGSGSDGDDGRLSARIAGMRSERRKTCKHTYYINRVGAFSLEGQCPLK